MKIKKSAVTVMVISIVVVLISAAYFKIALPVLNVLYNELPEEGTSNGTGVLISHSDILDFNFSGSGEKATFPPDATMPPSTGIMPGSSSGEAAQISASQVYFREGTKNILLLGYNEGLCDSIFILNIDEEYHTMKLVSVPRDTYVPYGSAVVSAMSATGYNKSPGAFKINASTYVGSNIVRYEGGKFGNSGIDFLCSILNMLLPYGCEIDEYVYLEFEGFMDIIDAVGGVEATIPANIYSNTGKLLLAQGKQHLTSSQALTYVRHRTVYDQYGNNVGTGSDNYRKMNQVNFLVEISSQIITTENMKISKLTAMMESLKKSVFHSFGDLSKVQTYAEIGMDFASGKYTIEPYVVVGENIDPLGDGASYVQIH